MMHPMVYASGLRAIVNELVAEERIDEAEELAALAVEWEEVAKAEARTRTKTWTAIATETFPNFEGKTPAAQRLLDLMRHNDVT